MQTVGQFVTLFVVPRGGWGRHDGALGRRQLNDQCLIVSGVGLSSGQKGEVVTPICGIVARNGEVW